LEIAKETDSNSIVYRSVLTKYLKGVRSLVNTGKREEGRIYAHNMAIRNLYQLAFGDEDTTGIFESAKIIIESAHPEKIIRPDEENYHRWKIDNLYCYEIKVPVSKQKEIHKIMRKDLEQLFGYNVYLEYRTQRCLVLKADKNFHYLQDTTITPKISVGAGGFTVRNYPFGKLASGIKGFMPKEIFLDETGLTGKVDITIQAEMTDVKSLNTELNKYGLFLQYENRKVQMLIIKDPS